MPDRVQTGCQLHPAPENWFSDPAESSDGSEAGYLPQYETVIYASRYEENPSPADCPPNPPSRSETNPSLLHIPDDRIDRCEYVGGPLEDFAFMVEDVPVDHQPNPELENSWSATLANFESALGTDDIVSQDALFTELISLAVRRHGLENSFEDLQASKHVEESLDSAAAYVDSNNHIALSMSSLSSGDIDWYERTGDDPETMAQEAAHFGIYDLLGQQSQVVEARERIRAASLAALEADFTAIENVIDRTSSYMQSPLVASNFAVAFRSLNDLERAKKYFEEARDNPAQSAAGIMWFSTQALEMAIAIAAQKGDTDKIKAVAQELEQMRGNLPTLLLAAKLEQEALPREEELMRQYAAELEDFAAEASGEYTVPIDLEQTGGIPVDIGTTGQIYELDAQSWGVLYQAYLQLNDGENLKEMEEVRRQMVVGRMGEASVLESHIHMRNMQMVARSASAHWGAIEAAQVSDNQQGAANLHAQLVSDVYDVERLITPYIIERKGDPLFEGLAALYWSTFFDGYLARHLPQHALASLVAKIEMTRTAAHTVSLTETYTIKALFANLRELEPQVFNEDGNINLAVDMWDTERGEGAGDRILSAYWSSNSTAREVGVPVGAGITCGVGAILLGSTGWGVPLAALVCGVGATLFNRGSNEARAEQQYAQARMTGISRITGEESDEMRTNWYESRAALNLASATFFAPLGAGAVLTGVGLLGRAGTAVRGAIQGFEGSSLAQVFSSSVLSLRNMAGGAFGGMRSVGRWFGGLPLHSQVGIGAAGVAVADYLPDGRLNHWWGNVARTIAVSELGYGLFSRTWPTDFANTIAASRLWQTAIHTGTRMLAVDQYLLNSSDEFPYVQLIDFDPPRDTLGQERDYREQFMFDVPALWIPGLLASFGRWSVNEAMLANNIDRVVFGLGAAGVVGDTYDDGKINNWYGGIGGMFMVATLGNRLLNVPTSGTIAVSLALKPIYEWEMQSMHDVPFESLNWERFIIASAESTITMALFSGMYEGAAYANRSPLGRSIIASMQKVPFISNHLHCMQNFSRYWLFGDMNRPTTILDWTVKEIKPERAFLLRSVGSGGTGRVVEYTVRTRAGWESVAGRDPYVNLRVRSENGSGVPEFTINGMTEINGQRITQEYLMQNGYYTVNGKIYESEILQEGSIRLLPDRIQGEYLGRRMIRSRDIQNMEPAERIAFLERLEGRNIRWDSESGRFYRLVMDNPRAPQMRIMQEGETVPEWEAGFKFVEVAGPNGERMLLSLPRSREYTDYVVENPIERPIWSGLRAEARWNWFPGAWVTAPVIAQAAQWANEYIFNPLSKGDPDYQPLQRKLDLGFAALVTWPLIQYRWGFRSLRGRVLGGLVGIPMKAIFNWFAPIYLNSTPGEQNMWSVAISGGNADRSWPISTNIVDALNDITTSGNMGSLGRNYDEYGLGVWNWRGDIENRAWANIRQIARCRMDLANHVGISDSDTCSRLPLASQDQLGKADEGRMMGRAVEVNFEQMEIYFNVMAKTFVELMEKERRGDLSDLDRQQTIMLARWFKQLLKPESQDIYEPDRPDGTGCFDTLAGIRSVHLYSGYGWLIDEIPNLQTPTDDDRFVSDVRGHKSCVSRFYMDERMNNGREHWNTCFIQNTSSPSGQSQCMQTNN